MMNKKRGPLDPEGSTADWYIHRKYKDLQEEVLCNAICRVSKTDWDNIQDKASIYWQTMLAKSMICQREDETKEIEGSSQYYEMQNGDKVQRHHLMALIMYTCYDVCTVTYVASAVFVQTFL